MDSFLAASSENSTGKEEDEGRDDFNEDTFGDGAVEDDWESTHYSMTGDVHGGKSPKLPHPSEDEVLPGMSQMKIRELWPSSSTRSSPYDSIWSSPELPARTDSVPRGSPNLPPGSKVISVEELEGSSSSSIPPGSKVISLEELEREITQSPSTIETASTSSSTPHPQVPHPPQSGSPHPLSSSSSSPAHVLPGLIQHPPPGLPMPYPAPPPQRVGVVGVAPPPPPHQQGVGPGPPPMMMPWVHMQQEQQKGGHPLPPPPHGFRPPMMIPPPNIPIRGSPGHPLPLPPRGHFPPRPPPLQGGPHPHMHYNYPNQPMPRKSKRSEYLDEMKADGSGFMTQKEKDWVIRIQLVQLQTPDPENEDYYYQNYMKRKLSARQSDSVASSSSPSKDDDSSPSQTRPLPHFTTRAYKPKEFEGTLGKLTVSSIVAPRKTIDIPQSTEGGGTEGGSVVTDSYMKKKRALIIIEKLYGLVLQLEELERKSFSAESEEERAEMFLHKEDMTKKMFALLQLPAITQKSTRSDDAVLQTIMNYRKGKRVIKRILPFLSDDNASAIVLGILRHLPTTIKRDATDQVLPELLVSVQSVLTIMDLAVTTKCLSGLLDAMIHAAVQQHSASSLANSALSRVCLNRFGVGVVVSLMKRADEQKIAADGGVAAEKREQLLLWTMQVKQLHDLITPCKEQLLAKASTLHDANMMNHLSELIRLCSHH